MFALYNNNNIITVILLLVSANVVIMIVYKIGIRVCTRIVYSVIVNGHNIIPVAVNNNIIVCESCFMII